MRAGVQEQIDGGVKSCNLVARDDTQLLVVLGAGTLQ